MAEAVVRCPHCQSDAVVKYGKASNGKERFRCQQREHVWADVPADAMRIRDVCPR